MTVLDLLDFEIDKEYLNIFDMYHYNFRLRLKDIVYRLKKNNSTYLHRDFGIYQIEIYQYGYFINEDFNKNFLENM